MTINELANKYKLYSSSKYMPRTNLSRFSLLNRYIVPHFNETQIQDIESSDIDDFFDHLATLSIKQNTIFGIYACLLSVFKFALNNNYIDESPMNYSKKISHE